MQTINKKAIWSYLLLTFGLTLCLIFLARANGLTLFEAPAFMSQMFVLAAMFAPAFSALLVQVFVVKRSLKDLGLQWLKFEMYFKTYIVILAAYIATYTITWLFVLKPDFTLQAFLSQSFVPAGTTLPMPASQMVLIMSLVTFFAAPVLNLIPSLGEEIGWRGFLLPNLEPLGQIKASIISGIVWALWHTPMIFLLGFAYGDQAWPGALIHFVVVLSLGIWFGYVWFKTRNTVLSGFMHAFFNANAYGIWAIVFVGGSKLIVGGVGLISAIVWLIIAFITLSKFKQLPKNT